MITAKNTMFTANFDMITAKNTMFTANFDMITANENALKCFN